MDVRRVARIIGDRWGVVAIGAVVGLVGGLLFLNMAGPTSEPLYVATASIRFDPAEGQTIPDLADEIRAAREFALLAAEELMNADPTAQITADLVEAKLHFIALGLSESEARSNAEGLLQSYLDVDPEFGGVEVQLNNLRDEAERLDQQIAELQPVLTLEQTALAAEQIQLDANIAALNATQTQLMLDEVLATTNEERQVIANQRGRVETELVRLRGERATLGSVPVPEIGSTDALLLTTLETRKQLLTTEFQRLYFRQLGVAGFGSKEITQVINIASEPLAPIMVALIGLSGGALLASAGLLMVARTRKTVWLPEDILVPVLGHVPVRSADAQSNDAWYDTSEPGPRRTAVQALRAAALAHVHGESSTIAITGHNTPAIDVQMLAVDLAGSMASAGESVLLIDANFDSRTALGEYRVGGASLADILRMQPESPDFDSAIDSVVAKAHVIRPGLAVIPSGPPPGSPADALAGRQYRSLIASAADRHDVTIIVVDDFGAPSSQVAMQRLHHGILVTTPGRATETELNGLLAEAERLRIGIDGAVFLGKRRRMTGLFRSRETTENKRQEKGPTEGTAHGDGPSSSPMTRLGSYSIPDERRTALVQHSPLGDLASSFGLSRDEPKSGLGGELLTAMNATSPERAYEAVADYVVSRAEDMVTARYGYGDLLETLTHDVSQYGFLSLQPIRSHRTVGSWLTEEIETEIESHSGAEVVKEVERFLSGDQPNVGIDGWLDGEFFRRHLARTDGEPEVWHLVSRGRSVSLLVPARRLSLAKFEVLLTEVVSSGIDEIERKRKAAVTRADLEQAAEYEQQVWDVRSFEKSLREVLYGAPRSDSKRAKPVAWDPDWALGTRANLAPFQRHGLLPFAVLTEDELSALMATA